MPHKRAKRSIREQQRSQSGHDLVPGNASVSNEGIPKAIARVLNAASVRQEWRKKRKTDADAEGPAAKRRRKSEGGQSERAKSGNGEESMKILPGESLAHFNRRVEDGMRPLVRAAMSTASSKERQARQEEVEAKKAAKEAKKAKANSTSKMDDDIPSMNGGEAEILVTKQKTRSDARLTPATQPSDSKLLKPQKARATEFATTDSSAPRRLNDVAQAPPSLSKVPKMRKTHPMMLSSAGRQDGGAKGKADSVLSMAQRAMMDAEREKVIQRYRELKERRAAAAGNDRTEVL